MVEMMMARTATYKDAGVDLEAAKAAKKRIAELAKLTFSPKVLGGIGSYGGLFQVSKNKILASSTDGVGTKVKLSFLSGRHDTVGQDLVNHCVNDIVVMGATPLFFLDYIGLGTLEPDVVESLVGGFAAACKENNCALIGGETAQLSGLYGPGEYDLAGFIVGEVKPSSVLDGSKIRPGDVLIGLPSSGLHTNGYSLALKVLLEDKGMSISDRPAGLGCALGESLMKVHTSYLPAAAALHRANVQIHGLAHITGGSFFKNVGRILPKGVRAAIHKKCWNVPPIFSLIQKAGNISEQEMFKVFNMGIGFIVIVPASGSGKSLKALKAVFPSASIIGEVQKGSGDVILDH